MTETKKIFLNKNGTTYGPFSAQDMDDLEQKGELEKFFWICTDPTQGWVPIKSPPPLPSIITETLNFSQNTKSIEFPKPDAADPFRVDSTEEVKESIENIGEGMSENIGEDINKTIEKNTIDTKSIEVRIHPDEFWQYESVSVVCHNFKTIVSGKLKDINQEGCTITQVSPSSKLVPLFRSGSKVELNFIDGQNQRSENIQAVVHMAVKWEGYWDYRIRWRRIPELFKAIHTR